MADLSSSSLIISAPPCTGTEADCRFEQELRQLRQQVLDLAEQVHTDLLTGLYNYRYFQEALPREMERTLRTGHPLSLMVLDIDRFKAFNDRWGHEAGNQALGHIGKLIQESLRKLDVACRYGGEEFVVILPDTDLRQAVLVAERLRVHIETGVFHIDEHPLTVTVSIGIDTFQYHQNDSMTTLMARADEWMYQAKREGRNRIAHPPVENIFNNYVSMDEKSALFDSFDPQTSESN